MNISVRVLFISLIASIVILREIRAREAITPGPDVGQIIQEFDGLHIDGTGTALERASPCKVDVQKDLPQPNQVQPLYLRPNTTQYWLPNAEGQLEIPRGSAIELYCGYDTMAGMSTGLESMEVKCLHDTHFEWDGSKLEFRKFVCSQSINYTVEKMESRCRGIRALDQSHLYRVGYDVGDGRFVQTMELCHDPHTLRTHYAFHQMSPASVHYQMKVKRSKFRPAGHFQGYDMEKIYSFSHQQSLLGGSPGELMNQKTGMFLARGHLVAKADLIYASQQRSSFNYMNAAPQWQIFNGGLWANLEDATRKFVANSGITVNVYTGTYGQMPLPQNPSVGLHLATDANNRNVMAVPSLFYRVLIDKAQPRRGIALVGVNNPHATLAQIHDSYVICDRIEEQVPWLRWLSKGNEKSKLSNLKKGYLYACPVSDLARVVKELPSNLLEVHELLT
ncbi:uncharacterized protein LOC117590477 isoform X2 [Drosophila guanche]|uniref:DNA/RNA non-specific endonuclease domain-containing protein n=1 Tax=Drosophila guanche TaxID=7266 RepID=A0A3B0K3N2_DROGU|nr:uncharacterized protein LOC117590477 isoform X2 [Drosophila guanche]SPP88835.1 Hypothetical predicted protein [Drosophila guanche]